MKKNQVCTFQIYIFFVQEPPYTLENLPLFKTKITKIVLLATQKSFT